MEINYSIVMLRTNKLSKLCLLTTGDLFYPKYGGIFSKDNYSFGSYQELYILSDENIMIDDHYLDEDNQICKAFRNNSGFYKNCKKIVNIKLSEQVYEYYVSNFNSGNKLDRIKMLCVIV